VKLAQAMDRSENLDLMFKAKGELTTPDGRAALGEAMRQLSDEDLVKQITNGESDHPSGPLADMLKDDDLADEIKAVIRQALIGLELDDMTWADRVIRDVEKDPDARSRFGKLRKIRGGKENREFIRGTAEQIKSGETEFLSSTNGESGESGDSEEEITSWVDAIRAQNAENLWNNYSDTLEEHKDSPSVAVVREVATSRNPSVMDSEVEPRPEAYWAEHRDKKTASKSHFSIYRTPQLSGGPSYLLTQSTAPPDRRQSSMPKLTKEGAKQVTADLDRLATLFQSHFTTLGLPKHIAKDMALRCDMLSDHIENRAGIARKAQMDPPANYTEEDVKPDEFNPAEIGEESAQAFLRNEDEPYMDAFKQDEFDQLREVQQDGMFSNAKAAAELVKKMAALLAENGHGQFSSQKKNDLDEAGVKLAEALNGLGDLEAKLAKFHEAAGIGSWTEHQAEEAVRQLSDLERQLADAEAEIASPDPRWSRKANPQDSSGHHQVRQGC
jgi:hypothetical protein